MTMSHDNVTDADATRALREALRGTMSDRTIGAAFRAYGIDDSPPEDTPAKEPQRLPFGIVQGTTRETGTPSELTEEAADKELEEALVGLGFGKEMAQELIRRL
jgi:hypothetical protein